MGLTEKNGKIKLTAKLGLALEWCMTESPKFQKDVVQMMLITLQKKFFKTADFFPFSSFEIFFVAPLPTPTPTMLQIFV